MVDKVIEAPEPTEAELAAQEAKDFENGFSSDDVPPVQPVVVPEPPSEPEQIPPAAQEPVAEPVLTPAPAAAEPPAPAERPPAEVKLENRLRKLEGHIGGLTSRLKQQQEAAEEALKAAQKNIPTAAETSAALTDGAKFKALQEEYPQFGDAIAESMTELQAQLRASADSNVPTDNTELQEKYDALQEELRLMPITLKHPDWRDTVHKTNTEFHEWMATLPVEVQSLGRSDRPTDVVVLLDRFEARNEVPLAPVDPAVEAAALKAAADAEKKQTLEAAIAPTTGHTTPPPVPTKTDEDDFLEGFGS